MNKQETFETTGEKLLSKVRELIAEGNVRKITVKDKLGKEIVVIPLTVGVVGALVSAPLIIVGAVAALLTECVITVERDS